MDLRLKALAEGCVKAHTTSALTREAKRQFRLYIQEAYDIGVKDGQGKEESSEEIGSEENPSQEEGNNQEEDKSQEEDESQEESGESEDETNEEDEQPAVLDTEPPGQF